MSDKIVIYKSKYGSTKQYAQWIADELKCEICEVKQVNVENMQKYSTIIFGACVYVGKILDMDIIIKNFDKIQDKKIVVFSVSSSFADSHEAKQIFETNIPQNIAEKIKYFHLRGRLGKLNFIDSILMLAPKMSAKQKYNKTKDEKDLVALKELEGFDYVDKKAIEPILQCAR